MSEPIWHCNCGRRVYPDAGGRKPNETFVLTSSQTSLSAGCVSAGMRFTKTRSVPNKVRMGGQLHPCGCDEYFKPHFAGRGVIGYMPVHTRRIRNPLQEQR